MEAVDEPLAFQFFIELLLNGDEHLWIDGVQLNTGPVVNLIFQTRDIVVGSFDGMRQQDISRGKRMASTGADFCQNGFTMPEADQVPVGSNAQFDFVAIASVRSRCTNFEQLRMQAPGEEVKIELGYFRSDG